LKKAEYCVFLVSLYTLFRSFYGGRRPAANIAHLPNADVSESEEVMKKRYMILSLKKIAQNLPLVSLPNVIILLTLP
jgi:hypothetical protein